MVLRFLLPQAVRVVSEGIVVCPAAYTRQLLPAPGQSLAPVGRRVPHSVVADRLSVVTDQLVLPVTGGIGIWNRLCGGARILRRCVGIDLLLRQVPPAVVGIRHRLIREPVVLPDQLVGPVVLVCNRDGPPGDRGYIPVVVVDVGRIATALVNDQQSLEMFSMSFEIVKKTAS